MSEPNPESIEVREPRERRRGCVWPLLIAVIVLVAMFLLFAWAAAQGVLHLPGKAAVFMKEIGKHFTTVVNVDSRSVTLETKKILELATVQQRIVCVTKYTTSWAGSTATIVIRGEYTAKAGFEMSDPTSIQFDDAGHVSDASLPPAQLLSLTTEEQKVFYDAGGIWNKLGGKDYEEAFRENQIQARREAKQMGILNEARQRLKERLEDRTAPRGFLPLDKQQ